MAVQSAVNDRDLIKTERDKLQKANTALVGEVKKLEEKLEFELGEKQKLRTRVQSLQGLQGDFAVLQTKYQEVVEENKRLKASAKGERRVEPPPPAPRGA